MQDIQDLIDRAEDPFELGDLYLLVSDQALEGLYQGRDQLQLPLGLKEEVVWYRFRKIANEQDSIDLFWDEMME